MIQYKYNFTAQMKQIEIKQYKIYNTKINKNCTNIKMSIVEIRKH